MGIVMDRYSKQISTGKMLEYQKGGDDNPDLKEMRLDTLKQNAINGGIPESDIEVGWATWEQIQTWFIADQSPLDNWMKEMRASDSSMIPRWSEDILDKIGTTDLAEQTLDKYNAKKALRATKPKE
tara:strand:- start:26 stop:403 length:378 start_codon:yes stop_codon:yes gene_type:complete